jgi:hypothetical protein
MMPFQIRWAIAEKRPRLRLHVLHYTYQTKRIHRSYDKYYARSFPSRYLYSFVVADTISQVTSLPLNMLLVKAKRLKYLTLRSTGQIFESQVGLLPPIKRLTISACDWSYTTKQIGDVWDFADLRTLELEATNWKRFLETVPVFTLKNLVKFRMKQSNDPLYTNNYYSPSHSSNANHVVSYEQNVTTLLGTFLSNPEKLEEIELICRLREFDVSSILKAKYLRVLKIRDFSEFRSRQEAHLPPYEIENTSGSNQPQNLNEDLYFSRLSAKQLSSIVACCPGISTLDVGFDRGNFEEVSLPQLNINHLSNYDSFSTALTRYRSLNSCSY